ncbi:hypothetical protein [Streptomyces sp. NBC_00286]|nr:hypothetical protein [Streptomyces sp. NBC_00286]
MSSLYGAYESYAIGLALYGAYESYAMAWRRTGDAALPVALYPPHASLG